MKTVIRKTFLVFLSFLLSLFAIEFGLRFSAFLNASLQEYRNISSLRHSGFYRIICIGESTTQNHYPAILEKILNEKKLHISFSVIDKGIAGSNSSTILNHLEYNLDKYRPDMVVAMMGMNEYDPRMPQEPVLRGKKSLFYSLETYKLAAYYCSYAYKIVKSFFYKVGSLCKRIYPACHISVLKSEENKPAAVHSEEELLKKSLELNPNNYAACVRLGWIYFRDQHRTSEAEALFKKAIEIKPDRYEAYVKLGWLYFMGENKTLEAEELLKKAIELNPYDDTVYIRLAWIYFKEENKTLEAEELLKRAIKINGPSLPLYLALLTLYEQTGRTDLAEKAREQVVKSGWGYYDAASRTNFLRLREILNKRRVKLVCVQYPMRSISPLREVFGVNAKDVIFVDNELIFKDAVRKYGFKKYFIDMFAGDFGHCTLAGDKLIAENTANTILKELSLSEHL